MTGKPLHIHLARCIAWFRAWKLSSWSSCHYVSCRARHPWKRQLLHCFVRRCSFQLEKLLPSQASPKQLFKDRSTRLVSAHPEVLLSLLMSSLKTVILSFIMRFPSNAGSRMTFVTLQDGIWQKRARFCWTGRRLSWALIVFIVSSPAVTWNISAWVPLLRSNMLYFRERREFVLPSKRHMPHSYRNDTYFHARNATEQFKLLYSLAYTPVLTASCAKCIEPSNA